jgi:hypothetical protein
VTTTATTALWFSSFKIFKHFRQIPAAAGFGKRKSMAKTRTEVSIETSEILIIKRNRTFFRAWCADCGREASMLPLQQAALLTGHSVEAIRSMMESRRIHFRYQNLEEPRICLSSLCLSQSEKK